MCSSSRDMYTYVVASAILYIHAVVPVFINCQLHKEVTIYMYGLMRCVEVHTLTYLHLRK